MQMHTPETLHGLPCLLSAPSDVFQDKLLAEQLARVSSSEALVAAAKGRFEPRAVLGPHMSADSCGSLGEAQLPKVALARPKYGYTRVHTLNIIHISG